MKYTDHGFRPLYKNFCIYPLNEVMRETLKDQKGIDEADGIMVYGYVDHEAGNTLELIALTKRIDNEKYSFIKLPDDARFFIRISPVMEEEFDFADYGNSHLYDQFKVKIDRLFLYDVNESIVKGRSLSFLDEFRYEKSFDDVKVVLYKEGLELEGVWAKIKSVDQGIISGILLSEPKQDFGVKAGNLISFIVNEDKNGKKTLIADLTPREKYTAQELADGKILKNALTAFNENKNQVKLFVVLELLRDSVVYVPHTKKGVEILTSNHKSFYPAFSSLIDMWQYENDVTKISMPFLDVVKKANKDPKLEGIVVNAFSDAFVIPKSMFELIEGLESRIKE